MCNRKGKDAYDELTQQDTIRDYAHGPVFVSVAIDSPAQVFLRVSDEGRTFGDQALDVYSNLRLLLERAWPGSVAEAP